MNEELHEVEESIKERLSRVRIDCPECYFMDDDQYSCTTCWHQGGGGYIGVVSWLTNNKTFTKKFFDIE
jgi:hypothetical protein